MPYAVNPSDCAKVLKAIGDETRIQILRVLFEGEKHVTEIAQALNLDQPHVSHHLGILRAARLVEAERDGKRVLYRLHPEIYDPIAAGESLNIGCCSVQFKFR